VKRTGRYESLPLNVGKWEQLVELVNIFTKQKDVYLLQLAGIKNWHWLDKPRDFRTAMKPLLLPATPTHLQDRALFDAITTVKQLIESPVETTYLKSKIFNHFTVEEQQHYAFWLLKSYTRIGLVMQGKYPEPKFDLAFAQRREVVRYLRRKLRKSLGRSPRVRLHRSMELDNTLYNISHRGNRQWLSVTSLYRGQRIRIPLLGQGRITGNIRLVLDKEKRTVTVHMPYDLASGQSASGVGLGIDLGVTEVIATSTGEKYGLGYGQALKEITDATNAKGKTRNRLYQIAKKAQKRGDFAKAGRIQRNNLGVKKLNHNRLRAEGRAKTIVGSAVHQLFLKYPSFVVLEDLSSLRGKSYNKQQSRVNSAWTRSIVRERLEFKNMVGGSSLIPVNAAFTSQTCPDPLCGYVNAKNRQGDKFYCLNCGLAGDADIIGAMNVLARKDDPEIKLYMSPLRVKAILNERFRRRKETSNGTPLPAGLQLSLVPSHVGNDTAFSPESGERTISEKSNV